MSPLRSLTVWLAFLYTIKGGAPRVVDELEALDVNAKLALRLGDGGSLGAGGEDATVKLYVDRLGAHRVAAWQYWRPNNLNAQIELFKRPYGLGVRHLIINAEIQFKFAGAHDEANRHVDALRKAFPDARIDDAPFALVEWHAGSEGYPYDAFARLDRRLLQAYPHEFGGRSPASWFAEIRAQHARYSETRPAFAKQPIALVGDLYGSALGKIWGMPKGPPAAWRDEDLGTFLDAIRPDEETHLYTIDAALAEGAPWRALQAACAAVPRGLGRPITRHEMFGDERPVEWLNANDFIAEIFTPSPIDCDWFCRNMAAAA